MHITRFNYLKKDIIFERASYFLVVSVEFRCGAENPAAVLKLTSFFKEVLLSFLNSAHVSPLAEYLLEITRDTDGLVQIWPH